MRYLYSFVIYPSIQLFVFIQRTMQNADYAEI